MGSSAEKKILDFINQLEEGTTFIEVGSTNPPNPYGSTTFFVDTVKDYNFNFYSVDISKENYDNLLLMDPLLSGYLVHSSAEDFLKNYDVNTQGHISFSYLDGFDWIYNVNDIDQEQKKFYDQMGTELNNTNSQTSHLKQTMLINEKSADKSIILYDDTWYCNQQDLYIGKGGASVYYLLTQGWEIINFDRSDLVIPHQSIMMGKNIKSWQ